MGRVGTVASAPSPVRGDDEPFVRLLRGYSAEVTTPDRKALDEAAAMMPSGAPVYIAALPSDTCDKQCALAVRVRRLGLEPVPHIVARRFPSRAAFGDSLSRLVGEAGVRRALVLAGDQDRPQGPFGSSLDLIETDLFQAHGVMKVAFGCYPEGHPRIADEALANALCAKLRAAEAAGLDVRLITQLCFEAEPIVNFIRKLRRQGVTAPLRVGT